jgi:Flp pilus assembly protein TadG
LSALYCRVGVKVGPLLSSLETHVHSIHLQKTRTALTQRRFKVISPRGQSFIELALILPILLLLLLGVVEVAIFIGRYLDVLDLTREAARFASIRDPYQYVPPDPFPDGQNCNAPNPSTGPLARDFSNVNDRCLTCSNPNFYHFYYSSACIFSPPEGSDTCRTDDPFCNGLNPYIEINSETDDVIISVFTVSGHAVSNTWPAGSGYWALSDHDEDSAHNGNWQRNCQGDQVRTEPYYTSALVAAGADNPDSPGNKGYVAVELYYCYEQVLNLPLFTQFVPNPIQIHAYTLMSLPASQPSATPRP